MAAFQKKLIALCVGIGVLAAAYVLGLVFSPASVRQRELEAPLIARLQPDAVAGITIDTPEGSVTVDRRGEQWQVPIDGREYPAAKTRVDALLDFLQTTRRSRLVTANPDAWKDFGVEDSADQKIQLRDAEGTLLLSLIVGKVDEGRGGTYVRLGNSNEVVLVNRLFDYYLNSAGRFWSYLRVFPADLAGPDINRITVKAPAGFPGPDAAALSYTLLLGEGRERDWTLLDSSATVALDNARIDRLANTLAELEGTDFATLSPAEAGLGSPTAEVLVSTTKGQDFRLRVGAAAGEDRYYAALQGGEYVYEVARFRLEALFKPVSEFRREEDAGASGSGK